MPIMSTQPELDPTRTQPSVLITAGPTHEPIDAVRYIANRSSGTLGFALAKAAHHHGCPATLLLGPSVIQTHTVTEHANAAPSPETGRAPASQAVIERFQTAADLELLLRTHAPAADILIMAAAVADYRPANPRSGKLPRTGDRLTIEFEPVPDLLAVTVPMLGPDAVTIGFALEEDAGTHNRALAKMARKGCHAIVLNPLATMDSGGINATILFADGRPPVAPGPLTKTDFAERLIDTAVDLWRQRQTEGSAPWAQPADLPRRRRARSPRAPTRRPTSSSARATRSAARTRGRRGRSYDRGSSARTTAW